MPSGQQFQLTINTLGRLVTVEQFGAILVDAGTPVARIVAGRRLDLDDRGAVIAENLGAIRTRENARKVDDGEASQRAFRRDHGA